MEYRRFGSNRSYMGTKRPLKRDLPDLHAQSGLRIITLVKQGGGTPLQSVLRAATAVKIKVNGQLEIFSVVNSQATISLTLVKVKGNFSDKTYNREIYAMPL